MPTYINLNGLGSSGKTTFGGLLQERLRAKNKSCFTLHLADPVKKICHILTNEPIINFYTNKKVEMCDNHSLTRRQLMEQVTAKMMEIDDAFFWKLGISELYSDVDFVIICDARYQSWYAYLEEKNIKHKDIYILSDGEVINNSFDVYYINNNKDVISDLELVADDFLKSNYFNS